MKKLTIFMVIVALSAAQLFAQSTGEVKGKIYDAATKTTLPGANVYVKIGSAMIGAQTDMDGRFTLKPLPSGIYNVCISYLGYKTSTINSVQVSVNGITMLDDIYLATEGIMINGKVAEVVDYRVPLISVIPKKEFTSGVIESLPGRGDITNALKVLTSELYANDDGEIYFRGSRNNDAVYIIDGITQHGGRVDLPGGAIGSMTVYTGGTPAQYGDFTGACIVIETKSYFDWLNQQQAKD